MAVHLYLDAIRYGSKSFVVDNNGGTPIFTGVTPGDTVTLASGGDASGPQTTLDYADGSCTDDVVRLVGTTLDLSHGFTQLGYPTTFPQIYNSQGTCVSLDFTIDGIGSSDNNMGMTIFNVGTQDVPNRITAENDHGVSMFSFIGDYIPSGDQGTGVDQANFYVGGVERVECGNCPSHVQNSP